MIRLLLRMILLEALKSGLTLLFPANCIVCHRTLKTGCLCSRCRPKPMLYEAEMRCIQCFLPVFDPDQGICPLCKLFPPIFRYQRYLWDLDPLSRNFIHTVKYSPSRRLARLAGELLSQHTSILFPFLDWDVIVPISASRRALIKRGFNQCMELARPISRHLLVPLSPFALKHQGYRSRQAQLKYDKRIRNVRDAFSVDPKAIRGKSVLLIDDVVTTGATTAAAAKELLLAGAAVVDLYSLARSSWWETHRARIHQAF